MTDYNISVVVDSDTEGLASGADQAAGAITELGAQAEAAGGQVDSGMAQASSATTGLGEAAADAGGTVTEAMGAAGDAVTALGETTDAAATTVSTAAGSASDSLGGISESASSAADGVDTSMSAMSDSFEGLSDTATQTAADIDVTLSQDLPASVDNAALTITQKASKYKAVGSQLGTQVASGIAGGLDTPTAATSIGNSLTGLLAVSAKSGGGILAAVGLGLGVAVVTNLIKGIGAKQQEVIDQFNEMFSKIEINAKQSMGDVKQAIFDAFDVKAIVTELGDGDIDKGFERIQQLADATGRSVGEIGEALQKGVTPQTKDTIQAIRQLSDDTDKLSFAYRDKIVPGFSDTALAAQALLEHSKANHDEQQKLIDDGRIELQIQNELMSKSERIAYNAERTAAAVQAAAAASSALASGLTNAATQAGIIGDTQ